MGRIWKVIQNEAPSGDMAKVAIIKAIKSRYWRETMTDDEIWEKLTVEFEIAVDPLKRFTAYSLREIAISFGKKLGYDF